MRRLAALSVAAALLVAMFALPAQAWDGKGYGDCDGWHVTNPAARWNSPEWEMVAFPVGVIIAYGETKFIPPYTDDETERKFELAWRLVDDGDNYQHSDTLKLRRDLTECTPTSTTEAPPSSTTTTSPPESSSTTTTETTSSTTTSTSLSTTTPPDTTEPTTPTSTTRPDPAPTITADTTSSTSSPTTTPEPPPESPSELPHTGLGSGALAGLAGVMGLAGLLMIGRRGDE